MEILLDSKTGKWLGEAVHLKGTKVIYNCKFSNVNVLIKVRSGGDKRKPG